MLQRVRRERFRVLVANVGDSRAALVFRDGSARPLSRDHKPDLPAERARVEATGGQVVFAGCWRVQGDLAVSRAFGDCHLKRWGVIAAPELVTYVLDTNLHRWLVLASDGLWDVMSESQVKGNPAPSATPPTSEAITPLISTGRRGAHARAGYASRLADALRPRVEQVNTPPG